MVWGVLRGEVKIIWPVVSITPGLSFVRIVGKQHPAQIEVLRGAALSTSGGYTFSLRGYCS
jgi:hypothetical protein